MNTNGTAYLSIPGIMLITAFLLSLPLVAMQITDDVVWNFFDFAFACALLMGTGISLELVARKVKDRLYRVAVGMALAAAFLLVWVNGAVGLIGGAG